MIISLSNYQAVNKNMSYIFHVFENIYINKDIQKHSIPGVAV